MKAGMESLDDPYWGYFREQTRATATQVVIFMMLVALLLLRMSQFERDLEFYRSLAVAESEDDNDGEDFRPTIAYEGEGWFHLSSGYHRATNDDLEDDVEGEWGESSVNDEDSDLEDDSDEDLENDVENFSNSNIRPTYRFVIVTSGPIGPPGGWTYSIITFKHYTVAFGIAHFLRDNSPIPRSSTTPDGSTSFLNHQWIEESFN
jgi:hypothetical protein